MLGRQGIVPKEGTAAIVKALKEILTDIESGALRITDTEDIHSFVESELISGHA